MAQPMMPPPITTIRCLANAETGRLCVANHRAAASFKAVRLSIECSVARVTMWLPLLSAHTYSGATPCASQSEVNEKKNKRLSGGGRRIRTYGGSPLNGFQDRRFRPLSQPTKKEPPESL